MNLQYEMKNAKQLLQKARSFFFSNDDFSYWPEEKRKKTAHIILELAAWRIRFGELNRHYFLYGFDVLRFQRDQAEYMDYRAFMKLRAIGNQNGSNNSQVALLRDKYLFFRYMQMNHMPVPKVIGVRIHGVLLDEELNPMENLSSIGSFPIFAKAIDGECGVGVRRIHSLTELQKYVDQIDEGDCLFQEPIHQHAELSRLNPESVNTLRIVTVANGDEPRLYSSLLRVGTKKSGERDNTSQGGIAIGIHEDGTLHDYGFCKAKYGGRLYEHPDTGIRFDSYAIPYYQEAVQLACRAHKLFYRVQSIGWDLAITVFGPVFVEGNDNWELQSFQAMYGGMRRKCEQLLGNRKHIVDTAKA